MAPRPEESDGNAGPVQVSIVGDIQAADGIAFDHDGNLYVADFGGQPCVGTSVSSYGGSAPSF